MQLGPPVRAPRAAAVAVVAVLVLTGCGGGDDPTVGGSPTATAPAPTAPAPTTPSPTTPAPPAETSTDGGSPDGDPTPEEDGLVIRYEDGEVVGGRRTIAAAVGETVTFTVVSDVADEVHVHGYDIHADVAPDAPAELSFTADIPGQFEIELEELGTAIAELEVR